MRRHPEIVARALLMGVEPLDFGYDMPSHVLAAVQRMWWEAEKDPQLKPYLPTGGLMAAAREVLQRLEKAPVKVSVKNGKTGEEITITLGMGYFNAHREYFECGALFPERKGFDCRAWKTLRVKTDGRRLTRHSDCTDRVRAEWQDNQCTDANNTAGV